MKLTGTTPFGDRVKQAREAKRMTTHQLADACGIHYANISGWENRGRKPDYYSLVTLAQVLECSIDWLTGLKEK